MDKPDGRFCSCLAEIEKGRKMSTICIEAFMAGVETAKQRLAEWQGVVHIGLISLARWLGIEEIQMLVHEKQGQATLVIY